MPITWKKQIGCWRWCIISRSTFLTCARAHPLRTRLSYFPIHYGFPRLFFKKKLLNTKISVFAFRPNSRHILDYYSSYVNILTKLLRAGTELLYIILGPMTPFNHFNHASDTRIPSTLTKTLWILTSIWQYPIRSIDDTVPHPSGEGRGRGWAVFARC